MRPVGEEVASSERPGMERRGLSVQTKVVGEWGSTVRRL
jgi:hypothetical protein